MKRWLFWLGVLLLTGALGVAALAAASYEVRWRAQVLGAALSGKLQGIPLRDVVRWLKPNSPVYMRTLAVNPNPFISIESLPLTREDLAAGTAGYGKFCAHCHGEDARGRAG